MNNKLQVGLLLQIPNIILATIIGVMLISPYLTIELIGWVVVGVMYGLLNIASLILIAVGIFSKDRED